MINSYYTFCLLDNRCLFVKTAAYSRAFHTYTLARHDFDQTSDTRRTIIINLNKESKFGAEQGYFRGRKNGGA
jgi:hypothetical protein